MIKKAHIKFICVTLSLLFIIFSIVFGFSCSFMRNVNDRGIERSLNDVNEHFTSSNEVISDTAFVAQLTFFSDNDYHIVTYTSVETSLNQDIINNVVNHAVNKSYKSGSYEEFCYIIEFTDNNCIIVGANVSFFISKYKLEVLRALTIMLLIYLICSAIVVFLSFSVFQPIKEALLKQKQFISNASHELKTPLAIISANAEVIRQKEDSPWIENIHSQTERMELLIQDLLSLAKMDEEKVVVSSVDFNLSEVVTNASLPFDAIAFEKGKKLNLFIQPDIQYKGDLNSVKNVINILLDNAVKHADEKGEIIVYLKKENSKVSMTIYNTGSNVSEHEADKVFERFYRGENSRSRESGGSGLGLSIAKGIADKNDWKISASCKLNEFMAITIIF